MKGKYIRMRRKNQVYKIKIYWLISISCCMRIKNLSIRYLLCDVDERSAIEKELYEKS